MTFSAAYKWCLLAVLLSCGTATAAAAAVSDHPLESSSPSPPPPPPPSPSSTPRGLCASTDSASVCLFKGLLSNALLYVSRRYAATAVATDKVGGPESTVIQQSKGIEEYLMEQFQNLIGMFSFGFELPSEVTAPWSLLKSSFLNGRGKKNKNLGPMLAAGVAVMAGTLLPLAFGALFMLAGKAIMTSLMAITITGLMGLKTLFSKHEGTNGHIKYAAAAPLPHYTEAQFEQELGVYKGQTEAKMHGSAVNYYASGAESSSIGSYYNKAAEQHLAGGGNGPGGEYYAAAGTGVSPKFNAAAVGHRHNHSHPESHEIAASAMATGKDE